MAKGLKRLLRVRFPCLVLLAAGLALTLRPAAGQAVNSLEYPVKATFLYKFAPFVEWPATAFETPTSPVSICVVGSDAVGALIDQAVAGQQIGDRAIEVRHLQSAVRDSGCHILYFADSATQSIKQGLDAVRGTPVLTVTESGHDAGATGIIRFVIQDNRVRFDIDDAAAAESGLVISSKLLSLAHSVRTRP